MKIPALSGKGSDNNRLILEYVALNGPQLKYRIFKDLEARGLDRYSTVSWRVDALTKTGYLAEALEIPTERGKQIKESGYGLTWRGFIASLSIKEVRENIFQTLERNPLLTFPEKDSILLVLKEIYSQHDLEAISELILEAYLKVIPNVELIKDENLWMCLLAIREFPPGLKDLKPSKMPEDAWNLLDKPAIFQLVKEKLGFRELRLYKKS